jgi:hypothetical protein
MLALIDRERERLHRYAKKWGFSDRRTIRQSQRVDRLIYIFMASSGSVSKSAY